MAVFQESFTYENRWHSWPPSALDWREDNMLAYTVEADLTGWGVGKGDFKALAGVIGASWCCRLGNKLVKSLDPPTPNIVTCHVILIFGL